MCELRAIGTELVATPLVPTPPVSAVRARADRYVAGRRRRNALVASIVLGLAVTGITKLTLTSSVQSVRLVDEPGGLEVPAGPTTTTVPQLPALDIDVDFLPWSGSTFDGDWSATRTKKTPSCPVEADRTLAPIKVLVHRAPVAAGQVDTYEYVKEFFERFNNLSSVCGRAVELVSSTLANLENVSRDAVAVLGLPLDPTLDHAIADGRFERVGIPVVGGDGLATAHHGSSAVYPVGTSAAALARMAVHEAWAQGARTFAVVHDTSTPFGPETAAAVDQYVRKLGGTMKADVAVDASLGVDPAKTAEFNRACSGDACDVVFLALFPDAAANWLLANPRTARLGMAALPTLLTSGFAEACFKMATDRCDGLVAWSGFIPPFGEHEFNIEAAHAWGLHGDEGGSAMVEAAVVGGRVLLEALTVAGPDVSRASLHRVLDRLTFRSYVTSPLSWSRRLPRVGNPTAQAWRLAVDTVVKTQDGVSVYTPDDMSKPLPERQWHATGTGWRTDPQ